MQTNEASQKLKKIHWCAEQGKWVFWEFKAHLRGIKIQRSRHLIWISCTSSTGNAVKKTSIWREYEWHWLEYEWHLLASISKNILGETFWCKRDDDILFKAKNVDEWLLFLLFVLGQNCTKSICFNQCTLKTYRSENTFWGSLNLIIGITLLGEKTRAQNNGSHSQKIYQQLF